MSLLDRLERLPPRKLALLALDLQSKLDRLQQQARQDHARAIAIVGMSCRLPGGADTPEAFWELLRSGTDAVAEVPADRWDVARYYDPDPEIPGRMYVTRGGFLRNVHEFDAGFFGISPREVASMDPQHRILLEVTWEALERAGQNPAGLRGSKTGVFVGISQSDYAQIVAAGGPEYVDAYLLTGTALNFAAGRLAYVLGLNGPALAVDTACSSSLAAIHLACRSLRTGDCDIALAGGVNLILQPDGMIVTSKARMLSPSGRCRTFDASADGIVRAEGCGMLVLKPLQAAIDARDPIVAVIRGSAMNQDGRSSGITVPNGRAQETLIEDALKDAGVDPREIAYVEAHGTGTRLGDPIEMRALASVFGPGRPADAPLLVGSVKTNIGHAESAAGVLGLIKAVLALHHGEVPPHLHLDELNPDIQLDEAAIRIPTAATPWSGAHRVAGVSSFGASGTNVHVVIEAGPGETPAAEAAIELPLQVLTLSARDAGALTAQIAQHRLIAASGAALGDICFTAGAGRAHFAHRLAVVAGSTEDLARLLAETATDTDPGVVRGVAGSGAGTKTAFVFRGDAIAQPGLARELFEIQPAFRSALRRCDSLMEAAGGASPIATLYGRDAAPGSPSASPAQCLFAVQFALADMWRSWGVQPSAVLGIGVGEYVAACIAGIMSLEDAVRLVVRFAPGVFAQPSLEQVVRAIVFGPSRLLFASAATGQCVEPASAFGAGNVLRPAQEPARVIEAVHALVQRGCGVFLEFGSPSFGVAPPGIETLWVSALHEHGADWKQSLETLARLYVRGTNIDWDGFYKDQRRRKVLLPTYPFQRERYWIAPAASSSGQTDVAVEAAAARHTARQRSSLTADTVRKTDPAARLELLIDFCGAQLCAVARVDSVRPAEPLNELGVDSLMAIELRNRIQRALDVEVPVGTFLDGTSVEGLARMLLAAFPDSLRDSRPPQTATAARVPSNVTPEQAQVLLEKLDDLSDVEVEHLLAALAPDSRR